MIEVKNLTKDFRKKRALNSVSFTLENGVYGLLGANGAGKTTLLRCLTLIYPEGGSAVFKDGVPAEKDKDFLSRVGYLPQQFGLFKELTVFDALRLLSNFKTPGKKADERDIERCLELVNLSEEKDRRISALSGGMVRRVGIAQALLGKPELLIFDEPTAGLDPVERLRFKSVIAKEREGKTVIISTHIVEDIEAVCDSVLVLNNGTFLGNFSCDELRLRAKGKVFEAPENAETPQEAFVERIFERGSEAYKRVLSGKNAGWELCEPTLEDGYLCVINNI